MKKIDKNGVEYSQFIFRTPHGNKNRVTVVGWYYADKRVLRVAVSRCSKNDQFVKKLGVKLADERIMTDASILFKFDGEEDFRSIHFKGLARMIAAFIGQTNVGFLSGVESNLLTQLLFGVSPLIRRI